MKTAGIIGGIGPESTIEYYRLIIEGYRARNPEPGNASIMINSVDVNRLLAWMTVGELGAVTDYLLYEIKRLVRAGAAFAAIAANTPHIVFDELQRHSAIPLISIVEATREAAETSGMKRVGLLGTRFTMQSRFYPEVFARTGISLIVPDEDEQNYIHAKYLEELLNNVFLPETHEQLLAIADRMKERDGIEGLILGGTELPLILRDSEYHGIHFLNTTTIHVDRIVRELIS